MIAFPIPRHHTDTLCDVYCYVGAERRTMKGYKARWIAGLIPTLIVILLFLRWHQERRISTIRQQLDAGIQHLEAGNEHFSAGHYEKAIAEFEKALQDRPEWDIAQENIAIVKKRIAAANTFPVPPDRRIEETVKALDRRDYPSARIMALHLTNEQRRVAMLEKITEAEEKEQ